MIAPDKQRHLLQRHNKNNLGAHSTVRMRPKNSAITYKGAATNLHAYQNAQFYKKNRLLYITTSTSCFYTLHDVMSLLIY